VLSQDETPLLYSLVFGEGVVNDATSVVLFNAIRKFDLSHGGSRIALQFMGNFLVLFITSTLLGIMVGTSESLPLSSVVPCKMSLSVILFSH
jgi:solute carrier family 9 (sodium/hydrogen exchanger), member 8